jgi:N-acetylated-alpha-linked acidic dipeptidase
MHPLLSSFLVFCLLAPLHSAQTKLTERALTNNSGLPRRPWFKHQIYAPGFYTGYGVKTLPGVREAIEQRDWAEAAQQIEIVSKTIENFASEIDRATKLAQGQ